LLGFGLVVCFKEKRAFKRFQNLLSGVFADSAMAMTLLSFDPAVSMTPLSHNASHIQNLIFTDSACHRQF
jgi:hypothetical protein